MAAPQRRIVGRTTTLDSFDRHLAVNARASWLLIREFATRYQSDFLCSSAGGWINGQLIHSDGGICA